MAKSVGMEVSLAIAQAARLANVDVVAAYPITPQTHIVEQLAELVANGELDASYIPVESEHSAMSACLGSSAVGARTFTATAGQGLELMHEVLYVASGMRLPIVMAVANRSLSPPISIWGDHSDAMAVRDTGWIQIFVENGQQAVDNLICAFRIAENQRVMLPVMVHLDGFHLTHVIEPILLPDEGEVSQFIPPFNHPMPLDPERPVTMGGFGPPYVYTETKKVQQDNLVKSRDVILGCWDKFGDTFGRYYSPVECYQSDKAKVLLLTMGSFSETAMDAVDKMRAEGKDIGLLKLRLWRPFPFTEIRQATKDAEVVIVLDRAISFGGPPGPVCSEIRAALYHQDKKPRVVSIVGGLGGRDISIAGFEEIVDRGTSVSPAENEQEYEMFGVKE